MLKTFLPIWEDTQVTPRLTMSDLGLIANMAGAVSMRYDLEIDLLKRRAEESPEAATRLERVKGQQEDDTYRLVFSAGRRQGFAAAVTLLATLISETAPEALDTTQQVALLRVLKALTDAQAAETLVSEVINGDEQPFPSAAELQQGKSEEEPI